MTVNAARRSRRRGSSSNPEVSMHASDTLAIGEIDQTVFDCPNCSRPLALGAHRCPGCGTRLAMGVPLSKASVFVVGGLIVGLVLGGGGGLLFSLSRPVAAVPPPIALVSSAAPAATAAGSTGTTPAHTTAPLPSAVPGTGGNGGTGTATMPTSIQAAVSQAAVLNQGFAANATALAQILTARTFDASAVAQTLRSMSANSLYGEQVARRVAGWNASAAVGGDLAKLYQQIHEVAEEALVASVRNESAYRGAGRDMLTVLATLRAVDARVAALGAANDVTLTSASTTP